MEAKKTTLPPLEGPTHSLGSSALRTSGEPSPTVAGVDFALPEDLLKPKKGESPMQYMIRFSKTGPVDGLDAAANLHVHNRPVARSH